MGISKLLRKAAGLVIELPPEIETQEVKTETKPALNLHSNDLNLPSSDELDRRLAAMDATIKAAKPLPAATTSTIEEIVKASAGPNLDEITPPTAEAAKAALTETGDVDFAAIYAGANLPKSAFTAEQTIEMLESLPAHLPLEIRRQTVQATVATMGKAIGATPETIVTDDY